MNRSSTEWRYRVVCLDCGDRPFYDGPDPQEAREVKASLRSVDGHTVVIQWTEVKWRTMA